MIITTINSNRPRRPLDSHINWQGLHRTSLHALGGGTPLIGVDSGTVKVAVRQSSSLH